MLRKQSLVQGAFILTAGALISRALGGLYRFILPVLLGGGEQGAYGVGLYGYAYQIYVVALTISTVGLPLAISKLVSQRLAENDHKGAIEVFIASRRLLAVLGLSLTVLLMLTAPLFNRFLDPNAIVSIYAVAPAVFLVSYMSAYRGLFQGLQIMTPYAASQVYEQIIRIVTILGGVVLLLPYGIQWAAAGANFGAVTGAAVALLYLMLIYARHGSELQAPRRGERWQWRQRPRDVIREVLQLAIPISLAGLAYPLFGLVDLLIMPIRLQAMGFSTEEATAAYGALTQLAGPFVNVPLSFTTGFALALVPAIAESAAQRHAEGIRYRTGAALRMALLVTLPAVGGLMVLARELTIVLYNYPAAGRPLMVLAGAAVFIGIQQMSSGVLQGLGVPMVPVRNLMIGVVVKAVLTWVLGGLHRWETEGVALATVVGFAVSGILNLVSVKKLAGGLGLEWSRVGKMLGATVVMSLIVIAAKFALPPVTTRSMAAAMVTLLLVAAGVIGYALAVLILGGITEKDFDHFSRLQPLVRRLRRWGLLKP